MTQRLLLILVHLTFPCLSLGATVDENMVILAMEKEGRLEEDITRDQRSKPEAVIPLLNNLKSNPEKSYILWPDRLAKVEAFEDHLTKIYKG